MRSATVTTGRRILAGGSGLARSSISCTAAIMSKTDTSSSVTNPVPISASSPDRRKMRLRRRWDSSSISAASR